LGPEDGKRVILVGMPFGEGDRRQGSELRSLALDPEGRILDEGLRVELGFRPDRIAFVPSGELALVLGEDGDLASFWVRSAEDIERVDQVALPSADYGDLRITPDGERAFVVGSNSTLDSGVSVVRIACDGRLEVLQEAFFALRLSESLVLLPDDRAVLVGGQAVFEPVDPLDLRLLRRQGEGFAQIHGADIFHDFLSTSRAAASPDGRWVLVPNNSLASEETGQVAVLEVLFSADGQTVLLTLGEPGQAVVFTPRGEGFAEVSRIRGIGLAGPMALVDRGRLAGLVVLPSVDPNGGPNLAMLRIEGPGQVRDLGQFELGAGIREIPGFVAITP
jgi:hypothetical protein